MAASREQRALSFDGVAAEYERGRPGYAPEAIEWVLGGEALQVLDVGAGTGKLTRALLDAGHAVTAVEPLEGMRAQLQVSCPKARALRGTAEQLPLPDGSVDAVVVGSAFHWFDGERALVEFARVLRGPQILGLFGNTFDVSLPWVGRLRDLLRPATERSGHRWPDPAALQALWADVQEREFPQAQTLDRARLRDLALSRSNIAVLSAEQRETELARLGRLWDTDPELAGRTEVSLPWLTRARRCSGLVQPAAGLVRKT